MLLSDPTAKLTLLVPAGEALNATINACPLRNETMLSDLLVNAPELTNPLVGYHGKPRLAGRLGLLQVPVALRECMPDCCLLAWCSAQSAWGG